MVFKTSIVASRRSDLSENLPHGGWQGLSVEVIVINEETTFRANVIADNRRQDCQLQMEVRERMPRLVIQRGPIRL